LQKSIIVKAVVINLFDILPKIYRSCQAKCPAGYPISGPYRLSGRISGIRLLDQPDIRPAGYPAKTESGASLININILQNKITGIFEKYFKENLVIRDIDILKNK
jgi:hypothetical protein